MKLFKWIKIHWRKRKLEKIGLDFSNVDMKQMLNPFLSNYELEKMESDDIPNDEEIELYFKMYLKKFYLDRENEWSVEVPTSFEEFDERCKTPPTTIINENGETISFIKPDGYRWMISKTVDAFIGFPPNMVYQRYTNYEKLVREE